MTKFSFLSSMFLLLTTPFVYANDSSFGDVNGSIVLQKNNAILMEHETLFISEDKIKVDYIFRNTSNQELTVPIAFPMPAMYFGDSDHDSIQDFKVWADGKPVAVKRNLVILLGNDKKDITQQVKQLGWSENDLVKMIRNFENQLPNKNPLPKAWFDKDKTPLFTLHEYFTWSQNFPINKPVYISHTYTPSKSTGIPRTFEEITEEYGTSHCIDKGLKVSAKKLSIPMGSDTDIVGVGWSELSYILTTANNWKDTIQDFHLIIKKKNPSDLISLCFQGDLIKTDERTFEFRSKNFPPENDLKILFLQKPF